MKCYQFLVIWTLKLTKILIFHSFYKLFWIPLNALFGSPPSPRESRFGVDYCSRSNTLKIMVSAEICFLEAPPGSKVIDFLLFFKGFVRTLKSSRKCSSPRRILNVDICFKSPMRLTILLAQYQNHPKTTRKYSKTNRRCIVRRCACSARLVGVTETLQHTWKSTNMTIYRRPKTQKSSKYVSIISKCEPPEFAQLDPSRNVPEVRFIASLKQQ